MMIQKYKKLLYCFLLCFSLYSLTLFCTNQTDGFSIARITSHFPEVTTWNTPALSADEKAEVDKALSQSYKYLGCGGQCFAFVSQDNRYVLKLFKTKFHKFSSLTIKSYLPFLPQETRNRAKEKAFFKLNRDFNSYLIASKDLKEETGILYLHLNKTSDLKKKINIADKLGIIHEIDLDQFEFAIQKRAVMAYAHITSLMEKKDIEKAKQAIRSIIEISLARCSKGIYDEDAKIERNFGFIEDRPLFIDLGRFVKDPAQQNYTARQKDLESISHQLFSWIEVNYPALIPYFYEVFYSIQI
jgi:hypothetical protein